MDLISKGFDGFSKGTFGNGGQNIYVSKNGVLQRIFSFDINNDGYPELLFANSQSMGERPPLDIYDDILNSDKHYELPTAGSYDACFADIDGDGCEDLIIACQNNGTFNDISAFVYFGSDEGLTQKYHMELPAPNATGVAAGRFDGKKLPSVIFVCGSSLRIFTNTQKEGLVPYEYKDIAFDEANSPVAIVSADFDGDGYDDICVKLKNGDAVAYFGSPDGLDFSNSVLVSHTYKDIAPQTTSTQSRIGSYHGWRPCVVTIDKKQYIYVSDKENAMFFACKNRAFQLAFSVRCPLSVYAVADDLDNSEKASVVLLTSGGIYDGKRMSYVLWNTNGAYSIENSTPFFTLRAQTASIFRAKDGTKKLIVCCGGNGEELDVESYIFSFTDRRKAEKCGIIKSGDAMKVLVGHTRGADYPPQTVVVNHETGSGLGFEPIYVYLGGKDGYDSNRRLEFPGRSAVEGIMFDFNDDGKTDVLTVNCAENCIHLDPGCLLYVQNENGFDINNPIVLDSLRCHGAAVGDFNHDGHLDVATGGFGNKLITIFYGSSNGFTKQTVQLGPEDLSYIPADPRGLQHSEYESLEFDTEYGEVRWMFAADFNGDGWLDLFVSQISGKHCFILFGGADGFSCNRIQELATDGVACANAADLNNDGYLDLVLGGHQSIAKSGHERESYITVYWGSKNGYSESRKMQLPTFCSNSLSIGDFNSDGLLDIYGTAYSNGRNRDLASYIYLNSKNGFDINSYRTIFCHSGSGSVSGDFNGDGYTDLAVASHKTNGNHIGLSYIYWGGPDGIVESRRTELPTIGPHGMTTVDFGNIMDRSDDEFYYSEIFDACGLSPVSAEIIGEIPRSCNVSIMLRVSDNKDEIKFAKWSERISGDYDLQKLNISGKYLQYAIILAAKSSAGTPRITEVKIKLSNRNED